MTYISNTMYVCVSVFTRALYLLLKNGKNYRPAPNKNQKYTIIAYAYVLYTKVMNN